MRGGYLGVEMLDLSPELRQHFGADSSSGSMVARVEPGSPASKAGLKAGDIIVSVDGQKIKSSLDIGRAVRSKKNGQESRVEILRDRSRQQVTVTVNERERRQIEIRIPDVTAIEEQAEAAARRGMEAGRVGEEAGRQAEEAARRATRYFNSPEWKAQMEKIQQQGSDCGRVQDRLREMESRLRELEKKLNR